MSTTPVEPAVSTDVLRSLQLHFFQFHAAYPIGQIGLMRRVVGKPGAI